jgi:hypothetical protein
MDIQKPDYIYQSAKNILSDMIQSKPLQQSYAGFADLAWALAENMYSRFESIKLKEAPDKKTEEFDYSDDNPGITYVTNTVDGRILRIERPKELHKKTEDAKMHDIFYKAGQLMFFDIIVVKMNNKHVYEWGFMEKRGNTLRYPVVYDYVYNGYYRIGFMSWEEAVQNAYDYTTNA